MGSDLVVGFLRASLTLAASLLTMAVASWPSMSLMGKPVSRSRLP